MVVLPSLGREVGSEAGRHGPLSTPLGPAGPAVPPPPPAPCLAMRVTSSLCFRARDAALLPGDAAPVRVRVRVRARVRVRIRLD